MAAAILIGLREPNDFPTTSRTPPSSSMARIVPAAMIPVPILAGLITTMEAPSLTVISWGMLLPFSGIFTMTRRAIALPLRTASGMTRDLPIPAPTLPSPSPTTTRALNLSRRPPLTTFAIRRVYTTRSVYLEASSSRNRPPRGGLSLCAKTIRTLALLLWRLRPAPSPYRGIYSHPGQTPPE